MNEPVDDTNQLVAYFLVIDRWGDEPFYLDLLIRFKTFQRFQDALRARDFLHQAS